MGKLWEPNKAFDESKPQTWGNMPYRRLYDNLTQNELKELLRDAKRLRWEALDLECCGLNTLPEELWELTDLHYLLLGNVFLHKGTVNRFSELPDSIGQLKNLQRLDLSRSGIRELPDSIGQLKNLQTLDLYYCHLREIPYSLVQLGLPFELFDQYSGNCINLTNATLDEGDISLFSQPRKVIEAYYRDREQGKSIHECKVIFLGDGAAGKSSLIQRMTEGTFDREKLPTNGVNMTFWKTPIDGKDYTLRILDFGGQEIMFSMHRCFLTAHTVYVVVCESRDDVEIDAEAARWLSTVHAFAPGCPVILALNKADLNETVSVNERDLRERNPALKLVLKTSAAVEPDEKFGVDDLMRAIRREIPGAVNDYKMNADMLAVKRALENMKEDYISSEQYRKLCADRHITDADLQYKLLGFFRDLGVAYFYESDAFDTRLESVRVLNPEWLTNGIYRLILRTRENGFLPHQEIKDTLKTPHAGDVHEDITYTPEETEFVLHVMRFFQISHDMGGGVEMIPMKMSKTPPEIAGGFPKENALHLRWEGAYLPNNLIHRLVIQKAKEGELDTNCVWRTGGRFRRSGGGQRGGGYEALAEMNENALDVYVSGGRDCRQYMDTFREKIQRILSDLNLKPREIICYTVDGQTGRIPYQDVLRQYYDGKTEMYIPGIAVYPKPADVLRDTYYHWEQEAVRYREFMGGMDRAPFRAPDRLSAERTPSRERTPEADGGDSSGGSLDAKKKAVEIEEIQANIRKTDSETNINVLKRTGIIAVPFLIAGLLFVRPDMTVQLLEWLIKFFRGL